MATSQLQEAESSDDDRVLVVGQLSHTSSDKSETEEGVSNSGKLEMGGECDTTARLGTDASQACSAFCSVNQLGTTGEECDTTIKRECSRLETDASKTCSAPSPVDQLGTTGTDVQGGQAPDVHEMRSSPSGSSSKADEQTDGHANRDVGSHPIDGGASGAAAATPTNTDDSRTMEETTEYEGETSLDNRKQHSSVAAADEPAHPENDGTSERPGEAEGETPLDESNCDSSSIDIPTSSEQQGPCGEGSKSVEQSIDVRPDVPSRRPTRSKRKCSQELFPEGGIPEHDISKRLHFSGEGGQEGNGKSLVKEGSDVRGPLEGGPGTLSEGDERDSQLPESVPCRKEFDHFGESLEGSDGPSNSKNRTKGKRKMKRKMIASSGGLNKVWKNAPLANIQSHCTESLSSGGPPGRQIVQVLDSTASSILGQNSLEDEEESSGSRLSASTSDKVKLPRRSHRTCSMANKMPGTNGDKRRQNLSSRGQESIVGQASEDTRWFETCSSSGPLETETKGHHTKEVDNDKGVGTTSSNNELQPMSEADSDEELLDPSLSIDEEEYEMGDLVWAKHPWTIFWPAVVKEVVPGRQTKITVEYFNAGSDLFTCQYSIRAIRQFSLENRKIMSAGYQSERSNKFRVAVDEAMEYLEKRALGSSPVREPVPSPIPCQGYDSPPLTPTEGISCPLGPSCSTPASPPSPEMVVGQCFTIPDEPQDPKKEKENSELREKWNRVENRMIKYILRDETKDRLLKIWNGKIKSTKHDAFFSSSSRERDGLKYKAQIGPLITDEKIDEVTAHLGDIYRTHCQAPTEVMTNIAYILDVWLPEAVLHATCKSRRVGRKKASQLLSLEGLQAYRDLELV